MVGRVELKLRNEFDEMGEAGVRHEFFKGDFQANQIKEAFTYMWLEEKRRRDRRRARAIRGVLKIFMILVIAGAIALSWFQGWFFFFFKVGAEYLREMK